MISVVIPLFNKQHSVLRALQSVLHQTFRDFELLVVDDGSTDGSASIVTAIEDPRLHLIQQENQGVSAARNHGIAAAQCDLIAFLDADDEWCPTFLETVYNLYRTYPQCAVFCTKYYAIDTQGVRRNVVLNHLPFMGTQGILTNYFEIAAHSDPPIESSCIMVRKSVLDEIGGFPVGITQGEDLLTWARLAVCNAIAYSTQELSIFYPERASYYSKPTRIPSREDRVGSALQQLYRQYPQTIGLKDYIGHWYKMRASIYLRLPHHAKDAVKEICKSLSWNVKVRNLYLYLFLLLLPYALRMKLFTKRY